MKRFRDEIGELRHVFTAYPAWTSLAVTKFRIRHSSLYFGPLWEILGLLTICLALSLLWSSFWEMSFPEFFLYFFSGYTAWRIITTTINESVALFTSEYKNIIENTNVNKYILHLASVFKNLIPLIYQLPVMISLSYLNNKLSVNFILLPLFVLSLFFFLFGVSILFSYVSARFRDVGYFTGIAVGLLFFFTPVLWTAERLGTFRDSLAGLIIVYGNPIFYFIDFYRFVFGLSQPNTATIAGSICISISICLLAFFMSLKFKDRLYVWTR